MAIVTTASLHHPDQDDFEVLDKSYRVLDGSRRIHLTSDLRRVVEVTAPAGPR